MPLINVNAGWRDPRMPRSPSPEAEPWTPVLPRLAGTPLPLEEEFHQEMTVDLMNRDGARLRMPTPRMTRGCTEGTSDLA
jgi:hypothetical protein